MSKLNNSSGNGKYVFTDARRAALQSHNEQMASAKKYYESNKTEEINEWKVNELASMWIIGSDSLLYSQRIVPWQNNIARKMKKGIYQRELAHPAVKKYVVKEGLEHYNKEFPDNQLVLNKSEMDKATDMILDWLEESAKEQLENK